jgi:hypothetical protein
MHKIKDWKEFLYFQNVILNSYLSITSEKNIKTTRKGNQSISKKKKI